MTDVESSSPAAPAGPPPAPSPASVPTRIDPTRPHAARVYDWLLGGTDNYPADAELGQKMLESGGPSARQGALDNRAFMRRAIHRLAAAEGVRQFLDIGSGIPTAPNLHQIAQGVASDARVVYVDNDPLVLAQSATLLHSTPQGATDYIEADARDPRGILEKASRTLDFEQPVALSLIALLHFLPDEDGAAEMVRGLVDALPPGSFLVLSQLTADFDTEAVRRGMAMYAAAGVTLVARPHGELLEFFTGLDLLEPGLTRLQNWHPEPGGQTAEEDWAPLYAGVARKP